MFKWNTITSAIREEFPSQKRYPLNSEWQVASEIMKNSKNSVNPDEAQTVNWIIFTKEATQAQISKFLEKIK